MRKDFNLFLNENNLFEASDSNKSAQKLLQDVLSILQAQYWNYNNAHWVTKGNDYYGNHLLFQRLYEGLTEEFDTIAEKMVAFYGEDAVDTNVLMKKASEWVDQWQKKKSLLDRCIASEEDLQKLFQDVYDALKEKDEITLGLDDFLMATANAHETNLYLLKQAKG